MNARRLVVVVPGICSNLTRWRPLIERLQVDLGAADWLMADHGIRLHTTGSAHALAVRLCATIHARWIQSGGYDDLILIGHSMGGLLIREAYLIGLDRRAPARRQPWVGAVSRLVLFAANNRGFDADRRGWTCLAAWLIRIPPLQGLLIHDLLRGSRFITNLRISWIREFDRLGDDAPVVVQLIGDRDGIITGDDSTDVQQFPTGYQTVVPYATHYDVINLDKAPDPELRYALIRDAVLSPRPRLARTTDLPAGADEVIFILHGIRAHNDTWVADLERHLVATRPDADVVTAGYGYFSAVKFALPTTRRKPLRWFQDAYAERLARNPRARFQFIGHSNGTYLLGRSLLMIPGMRFDRLVLVGSVLPADYDWPGRQRLHQVDAIRNDRSARDVPVGILCSALRGLGMRDIGTAGVDGFYTYDAPDKREVFYYSGGHSAPLAPDNLPGLAAFAVAGDLRMPPSLISAVPATYAILSRAAPWLARAAGVLAVVATVAFAVTGPWHPVINGVVLLAALGALFIAVDLA